MDQRCVKLLILQEPVATDLRMVVAAMHAVGDLAGAGNGLVQLVALVVDPEGPLPLLAPRPDSARVRTATQLPVLTMVTGYARWASALLVRMRRAEDLYAGW